MNISVDYEKVFEECKSLLRSLNIPIAADENITIGFELKSSENAEGCCSSRDMKNFKIELKRSFIIGKNPDIRHFKNVLMHELIHTCPGCNKGVTPEDHPALFLDYAKVIREATDYNILEFEKVSSYRKGNEPIKIIAQCERCGCSKIFRDDKDIERDWRAKLVRPGSGAVELCPYCHGKTDLAHSVMRYKWLLDYECFRDEKEEKEAV